MESRPAKVIEAIVERLLPPASREHVLGDLQERYLTNRQYIADAACAIPAVLVSRVRRTIQPQRLVAEALALYSSFFAAAQLSGIPAHEPGLLANLAVPMIIGVFALVLRDAYCGSGNVLASAVVGAGLALLAAALVNGDFSLWIIAGAILSALLLVSLRRFLEPAGNPPPAPAADARGKAVEFETRIRRRNRREFVAAGVVVLAFGSYIWMFPGILFRISCSLIIAGAFCIAFHLYRNGRPRSVPPDNSPAGYAAFCRAEMTSQRDLLRNVGKWYLGPMIPGLALFILNGFLSRPEHWLAVSLSALLCAIVFAAVWKVNERAANRLQKQIDALEKES